MSIFISHMSHALQARLQLTKRMTSIIVAVVFCVALGHGVCGQPEQIHLSYGLDPTEMTVTWSTMAATQSSLVRYGTGSLSQTAPGTSTKFVDPGTEMHTQYIHRATMIVLEPGQRYAYQVGSLPEGVWSDIYNFTAMKAGTEWAPRIALYGDMGLDNARSVKRLISDVAAGMYDVILHLGDIAYDMVSNNGRTGDEFMNVVQPLATQLPYMTCPGNHEFLYNFTHYKNRFSMPSDPHGDHMFYSFNMGPAHVIVFSTEYLFFAQYGIRQIGRQLDWLKADLEEAASAESRAKRPWIITMAHRPMYCSNNNYYDCAWASSLVRDGIPLSHSFGLEKLFWDYGVDLMFAAHEHAYERMWPVYQEKVRNGSMDAPYTNPKAPVHFITGSAGCREKHDYFKNKTATWSAFRNAEYGYTRMNIYNSSHLYVEQVSDEQGAVVDSMWLIKDKHGPYSHM